MATLPQVAALSDILRKFELRDDVPNIEVTNASIHYDVADPPSFNSTGYVDALPFGDEHGLFKEKFVSWVTWRRFSAKVKST